MGSGTKLVNGMIRAGVQAHKAAVRERERQEREYVRYQKQQERERVRQEKEELRYQKQLEKEQHQASKEKFKKDIEEEKVIFEKRQKERWNIRMKFINRTQA